MVENATPHSGVSTTDIPETVTDFGVSPADIKPYFKDPQGFDYAVFDIETTGRLRTDEVNLIGIRKGGITKVFARTDTPSEDVRLDEDALLDETGENVGVARCDSEEELLTRTRRHVGYLFDGETVFVAYNGETFNGGFDIPFLRTRAAVNDVSHPFKSVRFLDPYEAIGGNGRLNTTLPSITGSTDHGRPSKDQLYDFAEMFDIELPDERYPDHFSNKGAMSDFLREVENPSMVREFAEQEMNDPDSDSQASIDLPMRPDARLDEVYDTITGGEEVEYDPYRDSGRVLDAWVNGNMQDIALHNIADLVQTQRVVKFAVRQLDPDSLKPKWL